MIVQLTDERIASSYPEKQKCAFRWCERCGETFYLYFHGQRLCNRCALASLQERIRKYEW